MIKTSNQDSKQSYRNQQLEAIRQNKTERSSLVSGILDVKLRQIAKLDSKDIAQQCQSWIKDKVLYYMNMLDEAELKYYMQIEEMMNKLSVKETAIQQQIKIIGDFEKQIVQRNKIIQRLTEDNHLLEKTLEKHFEFQDEDLKKYVSVNRLENLNRQLVNEIESLKKQNISLSSCLQEQKIDTVAKTGQISLLQNQVLRLKIRLHDQSSSNNDVKYIGQYKISYIYSISIKPEIKPTPKKKQKFLRQVIIGGLIIKSKAPKLIQNQNGFILSPRQNISTQVPTQTPPPYLWKSKLNDIIIYPLKSSTKTKIIDKNKQPKKEIVPIKKSVSKEDEIEKLKNSYRRQMTNIQNKVKMLVQELKIINDKKVRSIIQQKNQLQEVLKNRPSREQDIQYIHQLILANNELINISGQTNKKAQSAYKAMAECQTQLQRHQTINPAIIRCRLRQYSNTETLTPYSTSLSQRVSRSISKKRRNKSKDQDIIIASIIRDSMGSTDMSWRKGNKKPKSSLSVYRDQYISFTHNSIQ